MPYSPGAVFFNAHCDEQVFSLKLKKNWYRSTKTA